MQAPSDGLLASTTERVSATAGQKRKSREEHWTQTLQYKVGSLAQLARPVKLEGYIDKYLPVDTLVCIEACNNVPTTGVALYKVARAKFTLAHQTGVCDGAGWCGGDDLIMAPPRCVELWDLERVVNDESLLPATRMEAAAKLFGLPSTASAADQYRCLLDMGGKSRYMRMIDLVNNAARNAGLADERPDF